MIRLYFNESTVRRISLLAPIELTVSVSYVQDPRSFGRPTATMLCLGVFRNYYQEP